MTQRKFLSNEFATRYSTISQIVGGAVILFFIWINAWEALIMPILWTLAALLFPKQYLISIDNNYLYIENFSGLKIAVPLTDIEKISVPFAMNMPTKLYLRNETKIGKVIHFSPRMPRSSTVEEIRKAAGLPAR